MEVKQVVARTMMQGKQRSGKVEEKNSDRLIVQWVRVAIKVLQE